MEGNLVRESKGMDKMKKRVGEGGSGVEIEEMIKTSALACM